MIVPDLIKAVRTGQEKARVEIEEKCFMNERIQELYLIASEQFKIVQDQGLPIPYQTRAFANKFAELIVRECADIAYKTSWGDLVQGHGQAVIPLHLYNTIKEHFGVEE